MSRVLATGTTHVLVTFGAVLLWTGGSDDPADDVRAADPQCELFACSPAGLLLLSAGNDHTVRIDVEIWDGPPDADDQSSAAADTISGDAVTVMGDGPVTVAGLDTGVIETIVPASPYAGAAHVRVACTGRTEAARRRYRANELFFSGVERWHLRFWPATRE